MRHRKLDYNQAKGIFKRGVALEKMGRGRDKSIPAFIPVNKLKGMSLVAYDSAERTKQLDGLGQSDAVSTINNLVAAVPDSLGGISIKAVLLGALLLCLLRR